MPAVSRAILIDKFGTRSLGCDTFHPVRATHMRFLWDLPTYLQPQIDIPNSSIPAVRRAWQMDQLSGLVNVFAEPAADTVPILGSCTPSNPSADPPRPRGACPCVLWISRPSLFSGSPAGMRCIHPHKWHGIAWTSSASELYVPHASRLNRSLNVCACFLY